MNPQEFSWSEDQQVTVINPTDKPYSFKVHSKEYVLGAHKAAKMPGYIAWVYVYGMASQLCQQANEFGRWNEEGFRQEYYEKLVKNVDSIVQEVNEEPEPAINTFDEDEQPEAPDEPDGVETSATPAQQQAQQPSTSPSTTASQDSDEEEPTPAKPSVNNAPTAQVKPMTARPKAKALQSK